MVDAANKSSPGRKTTEALATLLGFFTPIVTAVLGKLTGWQLVAALGIAGAVVIAYIASRTALKLKGIVAMILLFSLPAHATPVLDGGTSADASPPTMAQTIRPEALDPTKPLCPDLSKPAPKTMLDKVGQWVGISLGVLGAVAVSIEKLKSILDNTPSVLP